jgi:hypothetical protein
VIRNPRWASGRVAVWGAMPAPDEHIGADRLELFDRLADLTRDPDATRGELISTYTTDDRVRVPPTVYNAILNRAEPVLPDPAPASPPSGQPRTGADADPLSG